jgi:hypothetical protein
MTLQEALQKIRASGLNDRQIADIISKKCKTPPQTIQRLRVGGEKGHKSTSNVSRYLAIMELVKKVKQ